MKLSGTILALILGFSLFGQKFEIPQEEYPFYNIIEWKGFGSILMNRDPAGVTKKVHLTLVGNQTTSIWQQSFNPNGKDFYYISSENARYVYFLDDLNLNAGKVSLHQMSSAGNVKSTSVALGAAIKKLGEYDQTQLQLMDVVTTDKALVHIFRYFDKKDKKYSEIATFVTHHNFLVYAAILGEVSEASLKEGNYGQWKYIGFTEDQICFAARDYQNRTKGWAVKTFTSKGAMIEARFIVGPSEDYSPVIHIGFGANGRTYLKGTSETENALLFFHKNNFYFTGITANTLVVKQLKEGKWIDLSKTPFKQEDAKKTMQLGIFPLNEGVGVRIDKALIFLPYIVGGKAILNVYNPRFDHNPSRFILEDNKEFFAVSLTDGSLYFDMGQLNKAGNVTFEFKKK